MVDDLLPFENLSDDEIAAQLNTTGYGIFEAPAGCFVAAEHDEYCWLTPPLKISFPLVRLHS
jgi:hypothetical protein